MTSEEPVRLTLAYDGSARQTVYRCHVALEHLFSREASFHKP